MPKGEVKAILFDLDGTLIDSFEAWFYVFNDALRYFGFNALSRKEFRKRFGAPIEQDVRYSFKGKTIKEVEKAYNFYFKKRINLVGLLRETATTLKILKNKKIKLGLITSSTKPITFAILKRFKLKKYFDAIVTMDDVKRRKPAPDMVLKACKLLRVKPKNTILVGDTKNDMVAGKRAGCICIGYKVKGDYIIKKLAEIERFIYV